MIGKTGIISGILLTMLIISIVPVGALNVTTNNATVITTNPDIIQGTVNTVTFSGTYSDGTPNHTWFEYGLVNTDNKGYKQYKTKNETATNATFTLKQQGLPLIAGNTYIVQAVADYVYGENVTFVMPSVTPHTEGGDYETMVNKFTDDGFNPIELLTVDIWQVYAASMGTGIFFGLVIGFIFINLGIKQRSISLTIITLFVTGGTVLVMLPPEFTKVAYALIACGVTGMLYFLISKRR